jgi:TonB-dependent starch-binding outer membrane protein SusC
MRLTKTSKKISQHFKKKMLMGLIILLFINVINAQERTVQGLVTDESKVPIPGANIVIKGTTTGTLSDIDGKFSLKVPSANTVFVISFMGYETQEIQVGEQTSLDVALKEKTTELEKVVVIGYGVQKKSDLTGAVASISSEQITKTPSTGIVQALQGKAAGVQVFNNSGMPGAGIQVRVRGINTITRTGQYSDVPGPMYVIDGVRDADINSINPNDIEHIEVLKDASSQAIYGSAGGNGVIIVTTKQGTNNQKVKVEFSMYHGIQSNEIGIKMCDTKDFIKVFNRIPNNPLPAITANPDTLPNTNWWNQISHNAIMEEYNLTISSGTANSTSLFSLGYLNQDGIVDKTDYQRYNVRVNTTYNIINRIKIGENINLSATRHRGAVDNTGWAPIAASALGQSPISYVRDTSSSLTTTQAINKRIGWGGWAQPLFQTGDNNPAAGIYYSDDQSGTYRAAGNFFANVEILKGLTYNQNYGFNLNFDEDDNFHPYYYISSTQGNPNIYVERKLDQTFSWNWQHVLDYKFTLFNNHQIDLMAGFESQASTYKTLHGEADSLLKNGATPEYQMIDASLRATGGKSIYYNASGGVSKTAKYGYFSRFNYEYKNLFLFQFTYRYDGSTNFGPQHRFGSFPALSTGLKFSELDVVKNNLPFLSFGKFRFGWGLSGNDQIPSSKFTSLVTESAKFGYVLGGSRVPGGVALAPGNPLLHWESIATYNYGLDLTFFNNKLSVTADYFNKNTSGMLLNTDLPLVAGRYGFDGSDGQFTDHIGGLSNKGIELQIGYKNQVGDLKYSLDFNITKIVSKLRNLVQDSLPVADKWVLMDGQAPGAFWGYKTNGLFRASDTGSVYDPATKRTQYGVVVNQPYTLDNRGRKVFRQSQAQPGDLRYVDVNGDSVFNNKDLTIIGDPNPKFTFGLTINLEYKGFDFNCFFSGSYGNQIYNAERMNLLGNTGRGNWEIDALNAYRAPVYKNGALVDPGNTTSNIFRLAPNADNYRISDFWVEDGSFIRLQSMQFGYTIPDKYTKKIGVERFRMYIGAKNLFTWTKYSGLDPELGVGDPTQCGVDNGVYPHAKMYDFGINLSF